MLIDINSITELVSQLSSANLDIVIDQTSTAYLIYTSGSTGKPKGVLLTHRNAVTFIEWGKSVYDKEALKLVLASTSICFDVSIFEIFLPLSTGGAFTLVDNALEVIDSEPSRHYSLLSTVPSVMTEMLERGLIPESVTVINLAGEPLKPALVERIFSERNDVQMFNLYGPTECTTYTSYAELLPYCAHDVHIGKPISNTRFYILDEHLNAVPIGVPGELYIAGESVSPGYLNREELNNKVFIRHKDKETEILYRTGDIVKHRNDGNLDYISRIDRQIKINGFRIEPGEIESVIAQSSEVKEVAVKAFKNKRGNHVLIAFVSGSISHNNSQLLVHELQNQLRALLPSYMLPEHIVVMESLPLTVNGKIDRAKLTWQENKKETHYQSQNNKSETATEKTLKHILLHILELDDINLDDDFFALGGDSFLAMRLVQKVEEALQVKIYLSDVIHSSKISELASYIDSLIINTIVEFDELIEEIENIDDEHFEGLLKELLSDE